MADSRTTRSASRGAAAAAKSASAGPGVGLRAALRLRLSAHDAHYGGGLVDGARVLGLFGDVATELLVRLDGDEGLFRAYQAIEFLAPLRAGDFVEVEGTITAVGATSRAMEFVARKVVSPRPDLSDSAADVLAEPVVVCRARGTCVVPADRQRGTASAPGAKAAARAPEGRR